MTFWCGARRMSALSAMKWTPQKTMNSAVCARGDGPGELQRVADEVGELDHLVALVVVAEDDEAVAERLLRGGDPRVHLVVGQTQVALGQRLALADALLLDLVEELDVHGYAVAACKSASGPVITL